MPSKCLQVVIDRCGDDGMRRVELAVDQVVSHGGDISSGHVGCSRRHGVVEAADGFANFHETYANGVEDESVIEWTAFEMAVDLDQCVSNIEESLSRISGHRVTDSDNTWCNSALS